MWKTTKNVISVTLKQQNGFSGVNSTGGAFGE